MGYNDHDVRQVCIASEGSRTVVPNFFFSRDRFLEDSFFQTGAEDGFRMPQALYTYCALYTYHHYFRCTSDHQALAPKG